MSKYTVSNKLQRYNEQDFIWLQSLKKYFGNSAGNAVEFRTFFWVFTENFSVISGLRQKITANWKTLQWYRFYSYLIHLIKSAFPVRQLTNFILTLIREGKSKTRDRHLCYGFFYKPKIHGSINIFSLSHESYIMLHDLCIIHKTHAFFKIIDMFFAIQQSRRPMWNIWQAIQSLLQPFINRISCHFEKFKLWVVFYLIFYGFV